MSALPEVLAEVGHEGAHDFRVDCGLAGGFDASRLLGSAPGTWGTRSRRRCSRRLTAPDGRSLETPGLVVAMTSADGAEDLEHALAEVPPGSRDELDACRVHLFRQGWPEELVGRIGSFVVFDPPPESWLREAAETAMDRSPSTPARRRKSRRSRTACSRLSPCSTGPRSRSSCRSSSRSSP